MYLQNKEDNFCNYYVLPLLRLNVYSFGKGNFVNSYLDIKNKLLLVKIKNKRKLAEYYSFYAKHNDFVAETEQQIIYRIPKEFYKDLERFKEGKYSEFSEISKKLIKKHSGLVLGQKLAGGKQSSDFKILVLEKHAALRVKLEELVGQKIPSYQELASPPFKENFININLNDFK